MSIKADILQGESKKVEFKVTMPGADKIIKTAVAFSNSGGGKLIIGIDDNGEVIGIDEFDVFELPDRIVNMIYDNCYPTIVPEIYTERYENKLLLIVEFYPGNLKPYFIKAKKKAEGVYVRVGATNKQADERLILDLERQKRNISFDEEIAYDIQLEALNLEKLSSDFYKLTEKKLELTDFKNLKLIKTENGVDYPTNGLILLSTDKEIFEYARIRCARFKGNDVSEFIDQKDFEGSIYEQLEYVMNFVKMYIEKQGIIKDLKRMDTYAIPLVAIREVLVNAVVHRDYTIQGADVKVAIFDDRLEITSPGALPKSLDVADIKEGRSEVRNKVIARFFKEIGYIEQWGTGIRRVMGECEKQNLPIPVFKESGNYFKVTIYKNSHVNLEVETVNESRGLFSNPTESDRIPTESNRIPTEYDENTIEILKYLKEHHKVTNAVVQELLNKKSTAVKGILKKMVLDGLLEVVGKGKNTSYKLK